MDFIPCHHDARGERDLAGWWENDSRVWRPGGGGLYFAHTPRETEWKREVGGDDITVLKCSVKMGNYLEGLRAFGPGSGVTFRSLVQKLDGGSYAVEKFQSEHASRPLQGPYDSVILDRGETGYPVPDAPVPRTRREDLSPGDNEHPGYEFIVYSWDQVTVEAEVPRDPVPN